MQQDVTPKLEEKYSNSDSDSASDSDSDSDSDADDENEDADDWLEDKTTPPSARRQGSKILRE